MSDNQTHGIVVSEHSLIIDNRCENNGTNSVGAGIFVKGDIFGTPLNGDNRIEGNTLTHNDIGIDVDSANNFIASNIASGNTTSNFDIAAGNTLGQTWDFEPAGGSVTTGNPWSNFEF